jgi:mannose-6-phosphate isomerase-like protein (cupin superfamily)
MAHMPTDSLDAVNAAPQFHRVLLENETVRVLDTVVPPGATVPLHEHPWPGVLYIVGWSDCVRRDAAGNITMDSRNAQALAPGTALWSAPLAAHTLENVGTTELRVIAVEQKTV